MMMGVENYIALEISGQSREAALQKLESMRKEINRLKKVLEEENPRERKICPDPDARIRMYREYIEAAKEYFVAQEWECILTQEEIKDHEFNECLTDMESITVSYGGYSYVGEEKTVSFDRDRICTESSIYGMDSAEVKVDKGVIGGLTRERFLVELRELHMGEWKKHYDNPCVLDGTQWNVEIKFRDGKKRKYGGSNRFPYNFNKLLEIMEM